MKEKKYNHSFASRLSRWVILVLLIMMGGLSYFLYGFIKDSMVGISADSFHVGMRSSDRAINKLVSPEGA